MSIIIVSVFELEWRWESVGHNYNYEDTTRQDTQNCWCLSIYTEVVVSVANVICQYNFIAYAGLYTGFLPRGANLEYVKKRGGEAVRSCRAAAGG